MFDKSLYSMYSRYMDKSYWPMRSWILAVLAGVFLLMSGCSSAWEGTGTLNYKFYTEAKYVKHITGKGTISHWHDECWGLSVLDDKHKKKIRPKAQSSPLYEDNLRSKYTESICVDKAVWDTLQEDSRISTDTIKPIKR